MSSYYVLKIQYVNRPPETRSINAAKTIVGRELGDIVLNDPQTSGRHAEILLQGNQVRVRDTGSTNGTWFNGQRSNDFVLEPGQWFQTGQTTLQLMAVHGEQPTAPSKTMMAVGAPPGMGSFPSTPAVESQSWGPPRPGVDPPPGWVIPSPRRSTVEGPRVVPPAEGPANGGAAAGAAYGTPRAMAASSPASSVHAFPGAGSAFVDAPAPMGGPPNPPRASNSPPAHSPFGPPPQDVRALPPNVANAPFGGRSMAAPGSSPLPSPSQYPGEAQYPGPQYSAGYAPSPPNYPYSYVQGGYAQEAHAHEVEDVTGSVVRLHFEGGGLRLFGNVLLGSLLMPLTLGLYGPWFYCRLARFFINNTVGTAPDGTRIGFKLELRGREIFWRMVGGALLSSLTLGVWAAFHQCGLWKRVAQRTAVLQGEQSVGRLDFEGRGGDLLVTYLAGGLLAMVTLSIYTPWLWVNVRRFRAEGIRGVYRGRAFVGTFHGTGGGYFLSYLLSIFVPVFLLGAGVVAASFILTGSPDPRSLIGEPEYYALAIGPAALLAGLYLPRLAVKQWRFQVVNTELVDSGPTAAHYG